MLKENEIQALYEELRPDAADAFSYTGEQLYSIIPALERMELFKDVEFEVLESPFTPEKPDSVTTVQLGNAFLPNKKVRIYSIVFAPAFFKENQQDMPHGVYVLPPVTSERDFKLTRSIVAKIDFEKILEVRRHGNDAIIEPEGQMVSKWDNSDERLSELKSKMLREFEEKLDRVFNMDIPQFSETSVSDVHRFGKVFLRVSRDSFCMVLDEMSHLDSNTYFRVIEPVGDLPF